MSGILSNMIERWFGLQTASGEGIAWSLDYNWPWPSWVTLLAAVLAVVFVVAIYLREGRSASRRYRLVLAAFRLTLAALVLLMAAQVTL